MLKCQSVPNGENAECHAKVQVGTTMDVYIYEKVNTEKLIEQKSFCTVRGDRLKVKKQAGVLLQSRKKCE